MKTIKGRQVGLDETLREVLFVEFGDHVQALKLQRADMTPRTVEDLQDQRRRDFMKFVKIVSMLYGRLEKSTKILSKFEASHSTDWAEAWREELGREVAANYLAMKFSVEGGSDDS